VLHQKLILKQVLCSWSLFWYPPQYFPDKLQQRFLVRHTRTLLPAIERLIRNFSRSYPVACSLHVSPVNQAVSMKLSTFRVPVPHTILASIQEFLRWRSQKGNHLGKMLFIIEIVIPYCAEKPFSFVKIPDLRELSRALEVRPAAHTMTPTDHISTLQSHSMSKMTSGARYGPGKASPRCFSPSFAAPKSQMISGPLVNGISWER